MTNQDLFNLVAFCLRPGMYLGNHDLKSIEGFLLGYNMAKNYEINFHSSLVQNIYKRHQHLSAIENMRRGNVHFLYRQIEVISKHYHKDPLQIFKDEAKQCLISISDSNGKNQFQQILKKKVVETIELDLKISNENESNSRTHSGIIQLHKIIEEWEGINLDPKTRDLILKLKDLHLNDLSIWMGDPNKENETNKIIEISKQILANLEGLH